MRQSLTIDNNRFHHFFQCTFVEVSQLIKTNQIVAKGNACNFELKISSYPLSVAALCPSLRSIDQMTAGSQKSLCAPSIIVRVL